MKIESRGDRKRGVIIWDELIPWIIGIIVLALILFLIYILYGKGTNAIEFFKNLLRFGR